MAINGATLRQAPAAFTASHVAQPLLRDARDDGEAGDVNDEVYGPLQRATGWAGDITDEHARFTLLEAALKAGVSGELVRRAVAIEPERPVASAVVVMALALVPDDEHASWLALVQAWDFSGYCAQRSAEVRIARRAESGVLDAAEVAGSIRTWSEWLQRRLSEQVTAPGILAVVANDGVSRRIRETADLRRAELLGRALSEHQVVALLETLCRDQGYCLPPSAVEHLTVNPPANVEDFTDAVLIAEGLDPLTHESTLRAQVRREVAAAFHREHQRRAQLH